MLLWRYISVVLWLVVFSGACDQSWKMQQPVVTWCRRPTTEAPAAALCVVPDYSARSKPKYQSPFVGPKPWYLPAGMARAMRNMVVHYTNTVLVLVPFIGSWGLPPTVERCIPALIMYMYPLMFAIGQAAPAPVPMPNPYNSRGGINRARPLQAATPAALPVPLPVPRGPTRGRPRGSKNKPGSAKPGRNSRTAAAEEALQNTRKITTMFSTSNAATPAAPSSPAGAPSPSALSSGGGHGEERRSENCNRHHGHGGDNRGHGCASTAPEGASAASSTATWRLSPAQREWIDKVKQTVNQNVQHSKGKVH